MEEGTFGEVFGGDTCDEDCGGLDRVGVRGGDEGVLASCDEVGHFAFDVPPYPDYEPWSVERKRIHRGLNSQVNNQAKIICAAYLVVLVVSTFPKINKSNPL